MNTSANGTIQQAVLGAIPTAAPVPASTSAPTSVGQSSNFYGEPYPVVAQIFGTATTVKKVKHTVTATCPIGSLDGSITWVNRNAVASSSPTFVVRGGGTVTNNSSATVTLSGSSAPTVRAWGGTAKLVRTFTTKWTFTGGTYALGAGQTIGWTLTPTTVANAVWWKMLSMSGSPTAPMTASWVAAQLPSGCAVTSPLLASTEAPMFDVHTGYTGR